MEDFKKKPKKRNYKPLWMLSGFLLVFGAFIYILTKPSAESRAVDDVQNADSADAVRSSWEKNKAELADDGDYIDAVRTKLSSFNLSAQQTEACLKWLPKAPPSLNLIVVPDLSGRINDEINNPDQIRNDTILLNEIWRSFEEATKRKMNSNDRLLIDVTGRDQAQGRFRSLANDLVFDLSGFKNKSNRLYFINKEHQFQSNIAELYQLAKQNPQGADYWQYFNTDLKRNIRSPTLFTNYRNLLIIITDGYLEAQTKQATGTAFYTGTYRERLVAFSKLTTGRSLNDAVAAITPIMDCSNHFPNLEVLVLEVNARHKTSPQEPKDPGTARDADILRRLWTDWFVKLQIKNASSDFFNERLDATDLTRQKIKDFVMK